MSKYTSLPVTLDFPCPYYLGDQWIPSITEFGPIRDTETGVDWLAGIVSARIQEHISAIGNVHDLTLEDLGAAAADHNHAELASVQAGPGTKVLVKTALGVVGWVDVIIDNLPVMESLYINGEILTINGEVLTINQN